MYYYLVVLMVIYKREESIEQNIEIVNVNGTQILTVIVGMVITNVLSLFTG